MSVLCEVLVHALVSSFPDREITFGEPPRPIATITADHPEVGAVTIYDDGQEVTICIGDKTHGHFNPYNDALSELEVAHAVAGEVVEFLRDLFDDRVLIRVSKGGHVTGWEYIEDGERLPSYPSGTRTFFWSGPARGSGKKGWLRGWLFKR